MAYNTRFYVGLSLHLTMQNETTITNINKFKNKKKWSWSCTENVHIIIAALGVKIEVSSIKSNALVFVTLIAFTS